MATTQLPSGPPDGRTRRGRRALLVLFVVAAAVALVVTGVQVVGSMWRGATEPVIVDRSPAPLLVTLRDVAEYRAATGTFQALVDLERDNPYLPDVISGERTTFFAVGNVDALVDFSQLTDDRVTVSPDRLSVSIALPAPVLAPATVDPEQSRVVGRDRGLVERLSGIVEDSPTSERELFVLAGDKIDIAARESDLAARAEQSTRTMLTGLTGSLGFEQVEVTFDPALPGP